MMGKTAVRRGTALICFGLLATVTSAGASSFVRISTMEVATGIQAYSGYSYEVDQDSVGPTEWSESVDRRVSASSITPYEHSAFAEASVTSSVNDVGAFISVSASGMGRTYARADTGFYDEYLILSDTLPTWEPVTVTWRAYVEEDVRYNGGGDLSGNVGIFLPNDPAVPQQGIVYNLHDHTTPGIFSWVFEGSSVAPVGFPFVVRGGISIRGTGSVAWDGRLRFEVTSITEGASLEGYSLGPGGEGNSPTPAPLPPSSVLLGSGLAGLGAFGWRRRKAA